MGPGYGGPGYGGGGGGGFMSSLFGGIGGAMAGNWLYDQFSGRHHGGNVDSTSYTPGSDAIPAGDVGGADDWSGGTVLRRLGRWRWRRRRRRLGRRRRRRLGRRRWRR